MKVMVGKRTKQEIIEAVMGLKFLISEMMDLVCNDRPVMRKAMKMAIFNRLYFLIVVAISGKLKAQMITTAMPIKNQYFFR